VLGTDASPHLPLAGVLALIVLALCAGPATAKAPSSGGGPGYACGINTPFLCVQGGTTKLTFRASWLARVRRNGWRMVVITPAVRRGNVLTMPIVKTGKLTLFRRSRVGGNSSRVPGGECATDGSLTVKQSAIHHAGGFALLRRGVRRPFDALVLRGNTFYWRGPDHREFGAKGPNSGTFGGVWHGSPRIDGMVSPNQGRTVISALRVTEVDTLRGGGQLGPVLGVMGSTDSRWRVDAYCQVIQPDPEPPPG
jgi:hypothetical protein